IGLMHSCCDMKIVMPEVWDDLDDRDPAHGKWDFRRYQPDAVTICLGQNDGEQDPKTMADRYVAFIGAVRKAYPRAAIVLLSSPMADPTLRAYQATLLPQV